MNQNYIEKIAKVSPLPDIGKVGIPDSIFVAAFMEIQAEIEEIFIPYGNQEDTKANSGDGTTELAD